MKSDTVLRSEIKIKNIVCTADLKQIVNIASFNNYANLSSNLDLYCCGYVKDNKMTGRVSVFASGKLISVGTKSPEQAHKEIKKAVRILNNYHLIDSIELFPKIQNIVGQFDLGMKIPLEYLARMIPKSMYEPEQFAGLIYRIRNSLVALLFASGKGMLVGAKSVDELNLGFFEVLTKIPTLKN